MAQFDCRCGHVFVVSAKAGPEGHMILAESYADKFGPQAKVYDMLDAPEAQWTQMYRCPKCGRLSVFWDAENPTPTTYRVEE